MIEYLFTKDPEWLNKWDQYVMENPKANHLMLSTWLQSYQSYGFKSEVGLILDKNVIVGGFGAVIPKFMFFKFYIVPHGPICSPGYEHLLFEITQKLKDHAKAIGCCYLQISLPVSENKKIDDFVYQKEQIENIKNILKPGKHFPFVYSSYGINWISFKGCSDAEMFLEQLTPKVRRNIRMPYNKGAKAVFATDESLIAKGYDIIIENAKYGKYQVRPYNEFKKTIHTLIKKEQAYFLICEVEGIPKAAAFFVETNGYITNIMGGVLREKPDIKLGYMLQWEIIKKSFEKGYAGYNISMGGSLGVQEFKSKFGAEAIPYVDCNHHMILNSFYFKLYRLTDTYLKPYKAQLSRALSYLK